MGLSSWPLPAAWATSYGVVFALIAASITAVCSASFLSHTSVGLLLACLLLYCAAELGFALLVRQPPPAEHALPPVPTQYCGWPPVTGSALVYWRAVHLAVAGQPDRCWLRWRPASPAPRPPPCVRQCCISQPSCRATSSSGRVSPTSPSVRAGRAGCTCPAGRPGMLAVHPLCRDKSACAAERVPRSSTFQGCLASTGHAR